jgi:hypothetical protein
LKRGTSLIVWLVVAVVAVVVGIWLYLDKKKSDAEKAKRAAKWRQMEANAAKRASSGGSPFKKIASMAGPAVGTAFGGPAGGALGGQLAGAFAK